MACYGKDFDVSKVTDALSAFDRLINESHKKIFERIFGTLQTGLSKLGETSNAGKKAGEFYTPHEVSLLMSEIVADHLKDREHIAIYDPTSGSGLLVINIGHSVSQYMSHDSIQYYAQELKENTYNLTRMNLIMRGINPSNLFTRNADTLGEDWPIDFESYLPVLRVNAVVSNPPYSQQWIPEGRESDPRYAEYGLAPRSKADYAFLLHDLYHIKPDGIMTIVIPHGVLFRGGEEEKIRTNLIEKNHIDAIIGMPANIFFGTGIPTIIMVLKQKREKNDVLIIDASKEYVKVAKNNKLLASHIKKIVDIPRYVDSSESVESWDIYASMMGGIPNVEIDELKKYWEVFPDLRNELFASNETPYSELKSDDVKGIIENSADIGKFFYHSFNGNDIQKFIKESAGIGTVGTYIIESGKKTPINLPSKEEQIKIGEYFSGLDNLNTLHQRKYDNLVKIKNLC